MSLVLIAVLALLALCLVAGAILGFAERGGQLSAARRAELAALLAEPLQVPAEQAEPRLNGIARGLLGPT